MALAASLLLGAAVAVALIDWTSVVTAHSANEALAKPGVMVLLSAAVAIGGTAGVRWIVVAGFVASLLGDVALLERYDRFLTGLGAFLVAHLFFIAAFVVAPFEPAIWRIRSGFALMAVLAAIGIGITRAARREDERMGIAVGVYVFVLSLLMIVASFGPLVVTAGAAAFAMSDAVLGWNRFVQPLRWGKGLWRSVPWGRLATHMLYHVGQWLFAVWAIGL